MRLRDVLLVSHLVVLLVPVCLLLFGGMVRREMARQAAFEVHRNTPIAIRVLEHELGRAPDLAAAAATATSLLRPTGAEPYPLHIWVLDRAGAPVADSAEGAPLPTSVGLPRAWDGVIDIRLVPPADSDGWLDAATDALLGRGAVVTTAPVRAAGEIVGAVIVARGSTRLSRLLLVVYGPTLPVVAALTLLAAALLALAVSNRLTRSLAELAEVTGRVADGELDAIDDLAHARRSHLGEVRALALDVQRMARRLRERMAFVEEFASHAAHELRTPISTLAGTFELLGDHEDLAPGARRGLIARAAGQVSRLAALVDGLLALARADRVAPGQPIDLQATLRAYAAAESIALDGEAAPARATAEVLHRLLDNLVENARRHGAPPIRLVAWTAPDQTGFEVRDGGAGIAEADRERVFDRFYTTDRASGLGLGLALVRTIARAHGGDARVTDDGHGVRVTLPR